MNFKENIYNQTILLDIAIIEENLNLTQHQMCKNKKKKFLIWFQHANKTLKIGLPVAISRSGFIALILIDTAMVGRISADELAIISIATGPQVFLMLVGLGLLRGGPILIAQAFGAGQNIKCGHIFRLVMIYALFIGIILTTIRTPSTAS